ncbi:hypothetical protein ID866_7995 [Astraeus odoratus]|nr:hypothetical protein ID866_7995 [Astraeus odoratus]
MSSLITFEQIAQRIPDLSDYVDGDFVNPAEVAGDTLIYPGTLRGKPVIVKCRRFIEPNDEHNAQTLGEAAIWIQLRHVNIHPLLGVARPKTVPNTVFMVADCTVNGNALDYVQRHDINPSCLVRLCLYLSCPLWSMLVLQLLGIARALKYLHSRGVYHGYRNVLVDDDGRALLTSSCCSSVLASSETTTSPPVVCATRWMAPEGISDDDKPKDFAKMDVWAFGMTILVCLQWFWLSRLC